MARQGEQPIYSIGAVARMLGTPISTLRAWEDRYGVVKPSRGSGSHRLYSRANVEQLRFVKSRMEAGVSAADAHRLLSEAVEGGHVPSVDDATIRNRPPLILIVERDPYAANLAEYFLRTEGWDVATALDATQAKLHFDERSPHVVIIDLLISGGAGFRLLRDFVAQGTAQVIAVSAIDSAQEALTLGASAFLDKPLEPLTLVSTVRDLAGKSALVAEKLGARI